jgi:hypothetical protein
MYLHHLPPCVIQQCLCADGNPVCTRNIVESLELDLAEAAVSTRVRFQLQ